MATVIAFVGSPRKGGNTDTLVRAVLEGGAAQGAETRLHYLNDLSIRGCQGCDTCKREGACVIQDDMTPLYDEIFHADGIVIGSPIYACYFSAQTKLLIDRWYALFDDNLVSRVSAGKRFGLVVTYGDAGEDVYNGAINSLVPIIQLMAPAFLDTVVLTGTTDKDSAMRNPEALRRARLLGERLASG
jgi:multimeric flavodoxin WrbA